MPRFVPKPTGFLGALKPHEVAQLVAARQDVDAVRLRAPAMIVAGDGEAKKVVRAKVGDVCVTKDGAQAFFSAKEFAAKFAPVDDEGEAVLRELGGGEAAPKPTPPVPPG